MVSGKIVPESGLIAGSQMQMPLRNITVNTCFARKKVTTQPESHGLHFRDFGQFPRMPGWLGLP